MFVALAVTLGPVYAKNNKAKHLPPGLQKKVARGASLPPGRQRKLAAGRVLDARVYKRGRIVTPEDARGRITIEVQDRTIRRIKATREILAILD